MSGFFAQSRIPSTLLNVYRLFCVVKSSVALDNNICPRNAAGRPSEGTVFFKTAVMFQRSFWSRLRLSNRPSRLTFLILPTSKRRPRRSDMSKSIVRDCAVATSEPAGSFNSMRLATNEPASENSTSSTVRLPSMDSDAVCKMNCLTAPVKDEPLIFHAAPITSKAMINIINPNLNFGVTRSPSF